MEVRGGGRCDQGSHFQANGADVFLRPDPTVRAMLRRISAGGLIVKYTTTDVYPGPCATTLAG